MLFGVRLNAAHNRVLQSTSRFLIVDCQRARLSYCCLPKAARSSHEVKEQPRETAYVSEYVRAGGPSLEPVNGLYLLRCVLAFRTVQPLYLLKHLCFQPTPIDLPRPAPLPARATGRLVALRHLRLAEFDQVLVCGSRVEAADVQVGFAQLLCPVAAAVADGGGVAVVGACRSHLMVGGGHICLLQRQTMSRVTCQVLQLYR